jgi:hypothetical protein
MVSIRAEITQMRTRTIPKWPLQGNTEVLTKIDESCMIGACDASLIEPPRRILFHNDLR